MGLSRRGAPVRGEPVEPRSVVQCHHPTDRRRRPFANARALLSVVPAEAGTSQHRGSVIPAEAGIQGTLRRARCRECGRMRYATPALLALTLLALALAACDSAPPTVGLVDTGARPYTDAGPHCHAHLHTDAYPDCNANADANSYPLADANCYAQPNPNRDSLTDTNPNSHPHGYIYANPSAVPVDRVPAGVVARWRADRPRRLRGDGDIRNVRMGAAQQARRRRRERAVRRLDDRPRYCRCPADRRRLPGVHRVWVVVAQGCADTRAGGHSHTHGDSISHRTPGFPRAGATHDAQ